MTSKEVAKGFVALHVHGEYRGERLQGEGLSVFGYGLYSNDVMIALWVGGKFCVLRTAPRPAIPSHLVEIQDAIREESPDLLFEIDSFETSQPTSKKVVDLADLTDKELLQELADRLIAHEESGNRMFMWRTERGYSEEDCEESSEWQEWEDLKTDHDEDWCRVRECVRFIKKDDTIWEC